VAEVERTEQATPTFKQQVALLAAEGTKPLDAERAQLLYKCSDCQATVPACRHRISVGDSLREARVQAVDAGVAPPEIGWLQQRFAEHGSPYSADLTARLADALPDAPRTGKVVLFASCAALNHDPDEVAGAYHALRTAGVELAVGPALCCGYPLDAAGARDAFQAQGRALASALHGVEQIVPVGPSCADTLTRRYREAGVSLKAQVTPLVDLLAAHVPTWESLPGEDTTRYAYHDPCFLGRRLRRFEEPRAVLRALTGRPPLELGWNRDESLCSGGGGNYPLTHPQESVGCASRALDAFRRTDAEVLVTGCPSAKRQFLRADPALKVETLVGVLAKRLA
jgi:Fe-S oxidoreductase